MKRGNSFWLYGDILIVKTLSIPMSRIVVWCYFRNFHYCVADWRYRSILWYNSPRRPTLSFHKNGSLLQPAFMCFTARYERSLHAIYSSRPRATLSPLKLTAIAIAIANMTLSPFSSQVRIFNQLSEAFKFEKGLRKGDSLPMLPSDTALEKAL